MSPAEHVSTSFERVSDVVNSVDGEAKGSATHSIPLFEMPPSAWIENGVLPWPKLQADKHIARKLNVAVKVKRFMIIQLGGLIICAGVSPGSSSCPESAFHQLCVEQASLLRSVLSFGCLF